jgi:hypothetical protein
MVCLDSQMFDVEGALGPEVSEHEGEWIQVRLFRTRRTLGDGARELVEQEV